MAGIYIHIPFCQIRCLYCDFFSSTSMKEKEEYIDALCNELTLQKEYLKGENVSTVYFGGGTPSQLKAADFMKIFEYLSVAAPMEKWKEVTLEANPDDISPEYLDSLKSLPFNRISLGVQSFLDEELKFLNRRHDTRTAIRAVAHCRAAGFENISIDLMYGLPGQTIETWRSNLKQALALNVEHISAYHLTYEKGTPLYRLLQQGKIRPVDEELSLNMFSEMIDTLTSSGFEHYEISNFSKPGLYSRHNSAYWDGSHYLGVGASAHSFNGISRHWNVSSLKKYVQGMQHGTPDITSETIDPKTAYNDFILTRLRTERGIDLDELGKLFTENQRAYCLWQAQKHILNGMVEQKNNRLRLTRKGIFISDGIVSDLMI